jgi:hypothetical protein
MINLFQHRPREAEMNIRSSGVATCLMVAVTAGCGTVTASSPGGGASPAASAVHPTTTASAVHVTASATSATPSRGPGTPSAGTGVSSSCQQLAGGVLTLASNGKTYCIRVGEKFDVYLPGTVSSRWMPPLASSDMVKPIPNGAGSLIAGLTLESFVAVRPGQVLITSIRPPCSAGVTVRNEAEPKYPLPRVYPLRSCPPTGRFSVSITVVR